FTSGPYYVWLNVSSNTVYLSSPVLKVVGIHGTYVWTIQTGTATNCTYNLNIANSGAYQQLFEVDRSNNAVAFVLVNPGSSVVYPVSDPYCQPNSWIYRRILNGTINGGTYQNVPGGEVIAGGNIVNPIYDGGLNDVTPTPINPNPGGLNLN